LIVSNKSHKETSQQQQQQQQQQQHLFFNLSLSRSASQYHIFNLILLRK